MDRNYPLNAWYQAAWSNELTEQRMLVRTLLDTPILLLRNDDDEVSAILDRCPHRFVPLSRGRFDGTTLTCGYHGLSFDTAGQCVHNPHGPKASHAQVPTYPVIEKYERVWIWFGEAELADPALLPDLDKIDITPATSRSYHHMPMAANWLLVIDNLLDLSHADYIHPALGGFVTEAKGKLEERPNGVSVRWTAQSADPPLVFKSWVPEGKADIWLQADWVAPSFVLIDTGAVPEGVTPDRTMWSLHCITPETATTCHYFFGFGRDFNVDDLQWNATMGEMGAKAFWEEDKPMIEGQQSRMRTAGFFALEPALLSVDRAAVIVRRRIQKSVDAEVAIRQPVAAE